MLVVPIPTRLERAEKLCDVAFWVTGGAAAGVGISNGVSQSFWTAAIIFLVVAFVDIALMTINAFRQAKVQEAIDEAHP